MEISGISHTAELRNLLCQKITVDPEFFLFKTQAFLSRTNATVNEHWFSALPVRLVLQV